MVIETSKFGKIRYGRSEIITMVREFPGFEDQVRFILISQEKNEPFKWLQSLENPRLAFLIIDPLYIMSDYMEAIISDDLIILEAEETGQISVFVFVSIPRDHPEMMSANLLAPLVVNKSNMYGAQLILGESGYSTEFPIFGEITFNSNDTAVGTGN